MPVPEGPSCLGLVKEGPAEGPMSKLRAKKSREGRTLFQGPENRQTSVQVARTDSQCEGVEWGCGLGDRAPGSGDTALGLGELLGKCPGPGFSSGEATQEPV